MVNLSKKLPPRSAKFRISEPGAVSLMGRRGYRNDPGISRETGRVQISYCHPC